MGYSNLLLIKYNNNESISLCLTKLLNFSATKLNERYDKKFQTIKEFGNLINSFMDKKKDKIVTGSYFLKVGFVVNLDQRIILDIRNL